MEFFLTALGAFLGALLSFLASISIEFWRKPKLHLGIEIPTWENPAIGGGAAKVGRFARIALSNEPMPKLLTWLGRSAAYQCTGEIQFYRLDKAPVFPKPMRVRWAGSDEPVTYQVLADKTVALIFDPAKYNAAFRRDCFPGTSELIDVGARFDDDEDCFGWSNDSYLPTKGIRNPDFRLEKGTYLVKVTIWSSGDVTEGVFKLDNSGARNDFKILPTSLGEQGTLATPSPDGGSSGDRAEVQWLQLLLNFVLAAIGVVALVIYGGQLHVFKGQLREMIKATDAAKSAANTASRQLEMSDRPWIKDTVSSAFDFTFQNGVVSWAVTIKAENAGHSVATAIFPEAKLIAIHGADAIDGPRRQVNELCDKVSKRFESVKNDPSVWGISIFPGDNTEIPYNVFLSQSDMRSASIDGGKELGESIFPALIGCVEYHYPTSERPHHTGFVYYVFYKSPAASEPQPFISIGKTLPSKGIWLKKAAQYAD